VVDLDDKDPQAYCNLGSCYSTKDMIDEAIGAFKKASELSPDYSLPHTNLGSLYATIGRVEKAIKEFKQAVTLNDHDALAWFNLYNCYKEVGRTEDGNDAYRRYEEIMKGQPMGAGASGDAVNHNNIPGGVSQSGGYAGGGSMGESQPGTESAMS
jgi:tetratricopeptide (TPR) repeat protein